MKIDCSSQEENKRRTFFGILACVLQISRRKVKLSSKIENVTCERLRKECYTER